MRPMTHIDRDDFYFDASGAVSGGTTKHHYHETHELYFLESGTSDYFISDRWYNLVAGDLIWIPAGQIHQTKYGKGVHVRRLINCSSAHIPPELLELFATERYLFRNAEISAQVAAIFDGIEQEYTAQHAYREELLACHIRQLFFVLARYKGESADLRAHNRVVTAAIEYVKRRCSSELTLAEVAEASAVSPEHLSRVFRKETGMGFNEYVNMMRLQRADFMLRHEEGRSISEVAYACGFNDSNYFSSRFKRAFGYAPRVARSKGKK